MKNISEGLARRGHAVEVVASNARSVEDFFLPGKGKDLIPEKESVVEGVRVRRTAFSRRGHHLLNFLRKAANRIGYPGSSWIKMISWGPRSRSYRRELRRAREFDLLAACPLPTLNVRYAGKAAQKAQRPLVIIPCFHTEDRKTYDEPAYYRMMTAADAVIALTEHERRFLHDSGGVPLEKIHAIGAGVDEKSVSVGRDVREKYGISARQIVLFVGQHGLHKGILHLIEAMTHVWSEKPDTALVIAGNPTAHTAAIEREVAALPPEQRKKTYLVRGFPESEKRALYDSAAVFVSVSRFESFGIVFLEAWLSKVPVVGCKRGGSSQIISNFRDGFLVDYGKSREMAGAILELLKNADIARNMGENGYRKVMEKYTWDKVLDQWESLYERVCRERAAATGSHDPV